MHFNVTVCRDEKEGVWFVQSSDVPGLNAEAPTLDALLKLSATLRPTWSRPTFLGWRVAKSKVAPWIS
jgi:hypothetical protein